MVDRAGSYGSATYVMRSDFCSCFASSVDIRRASAEDWRIMIRMIAEWWQIAPCLLGDYYPLTPYDNQSQDVWIAWQFDRPEAGEGVVQVFRRQTNGMASRAFPLRGLEVAARYAIDDFESATPTLYTGELLATTGLPVTLPSAGSAGLYRYTRL
jgi:alpha-galactosidase